MRTLLGVLALLGAALLGGCGEETTSDGDGGNEPERTAAAGAVGFELVEIVTETAVGGTAGPEAVALTDQLAVQGFAEQFGDDRMLTRLTQVTTDLVVPDDQAVYAAVVAIGCDVPAEVSVSRTDSGLVIAADGPPPEPKECFAPMTSVAVVLVDEASAS